MNREKTLWGAMGMMAFLSVILFVTSISFWQENVALRQELQKNPESPTSNDTFVRSVTKILQEQDRLFELTSNKPTYVELVAGEEFHEIVVTVPVKVISPKLEFDSFTVWMTWMKESDGWSLIRVQYTK